MPSVPRRPNCVREIEGMMAGSAGSMEAGELETVEQSAGRVIPHSLSIRWSADRSRHAGEGR